MEKQLPSSLSLSPDIKFYTLVQGYRIPSVGYRQSAKQIIFYSKCEFKMSEKAEISFGTVRQVGFYIRLLEVSTI
jgi:hypothetical protein